MLRLPPTPLGCSAKNVCGGKKGPSHTRSWRTRRTGKTQIKSPFGASACLTRSDKTKLELKKGGHKRRERIRDNGENNAEMVTEGFPGRVHPQKRMRYLKKRVCRDGQYRIDIQYSSTWGECIGDTSGKKAVSRLLE